MVFIAVSLQSIVRASGSWLGTADGKLVSLKPEKGFDFTHNIMSDGYLLHQKVFDNRGIKLMTKFRPMGIPGEREILVLGTFSQK